MENSHSYFIVSLVLGIYLFLAGCESASPTHRTSQRSYGPYQNLYLNYFRKLPHPDKILVQQSGQSRVYPESVDSIWRSCLNIIGQYDAVGYVSPSSHIAVVSHGMPIQFTKSNDMQDLYYDTLLVIYLQKRDSTHTSVYLAWLPPQNLKPTSIPQLPEHFDWANFENADNNTAREWTTAIIAEEFYSQLSTQLFYEDRWKAKFQF